MVQDQKLTAIAIIIIFFIIIVTFHVPKAGSIDVRDGPHGLFDKQIVVMLEN